MKSRQYRCLGFLFSFILFGMNGLVWSDGHNNSYEGSDAVKKMEFKTTSRIPDIMPVDNQTYIDECGSCHFPFQPGFLPANAWEKLMQGLADHFGENAELAENDREHIKNYLVSNAAGISNSVLSNKVLDFITTNNIQLRITKNMYLGGCPRIETVARESHFESDFLIK